MRLTASRFQIDWDEAKEIVNFRKHGVRFKDARAVFGDPLAVSRYEDEHGAQEDRWATVGQIENGRLVLVVHTLEELDEREVLARIISARLPTPDERFQYESGKYRVREPVMKSEYDFSGAERGKFYRKNMVFTVSIPVNDDIFTRLDLLADQKGVKANELANEMLKRAVTEMEATDNSM
jgi:uncharacterized DUF497 family protein